MLIFRIRGCGCLRSHSCRVPFQSYKYVDAALDSYLSVVGADSWRLAGRQTVKSTRRGRDRESEVGAGRWGIFGALTLFLI